MKTASDDEPNSADIVPIPGASQPTAPFAVPTKPAEYTDGRLAGEWESKYPQAARRGINQEACFLACLLVILALVSGLFLGFSGQLLQLPIPWLAVSTVDGVTPVLTIDSRLLTIFFVGALGGTTFSIKWLVHSAAKCKWHLDRRYWRMFVPLIGGVYACVVLTLFNGGLIGAQSSPQPHSLATSAAFAFLVGYFSDGVSGLLSNIANAVFGTLEKK